MKKKNLYKMSKLSDNLSAMLAHLYHRSFLMLSIVFCLIINIGNANAQSCPIPTNLNSVVQPSNATLGWQHSGNYSMVEYKKSASTTWTVAIAYCTYNYFTFNTLDPNTIYNVRVKSKCESVAGYLVGWSGYSAIHTFTTPATAQQCQPPTSINYSFQSGFGSISYPTDINVTSYKICWSEQGILGSGGCQDNVSTNGFNYHSFVVPSLLAGTWYQVKIKSNANCGSSASWSQSFNFYSTPNLCNAPYGLYKSSISFNSITLNTANLSFIIPEYTNFSGFMVTCTDQVTGVSKDIFYNQPGSTTSATITKSFQLPNLLSSRNYSFKVKLKCGTVFSAISSSYTFSTPPGPCNVPQKPIVSSKTNNSASFAVTIPPNSNYTGYMVEYKNLNTGFYGYRTYNIVGVALPNSHTKNFILPGLLSSNTYQCAVRLKCSNGNSTLSPWSNSFTTNANKAPTPNDEITADSIQNEVIVNEAVVENEAEEIIVLDEGNEAFSIKNESIENQSIIPFPNPILAGEELQLDGLLEGASVSIYSLNGQLVVSEIFVDENQQKIKIPADLPAAIYLIKLTTLSGEVLFKKLAVTNTN